MSDLMPAVSALEAVFGPASEAGFGSAVFRLPLGADGDLAEAAQSAYRAFVGPDRWARLGGDAAWLGPWALAWERPADGERTIVPSLRTLPDRGARMTAELIVDLGEDPAAAQAALTGVFDDPSVTAVGAWIIGDGAAMSGLALAGHAPAVGEAIVLVLLLD